MWGYDQQTVEVLERMQRDAESSTTTVNDRHTSSDNKVLLIFLPLLMGELLELVDTDDIESLETSASD